MSAARCALVFALVVTVGRLAAIERNCLVLDGDFGSLGPLAVDRLSTQLAGSWDVIHAGQTPAGASYEHVVRLQLRTTEQSSGPENGEDAYTIGTDGRTVTISSANPRGALFGVYEYVEEARYRGPGVAVDVH